VPLVFPGLNRVAVREICPCYLSRDARYHFAIVGKERRCLGWGFVPPEVDKRECMSHRMTLALLEQMRQQGWGHMLHPHV
jgi:hypothetical protein